jgi:hypothetical protein
MASLEHLSVGDFILPSDVEDPAQASTMKAVELLYLSCVGHTGLTSITECAEHAGLVNRHFCPVSELGVVPYSLVEPCHHGYSLADSWLRL